MEKDNLRRIRLLKTCAMAAVYVETGLYLGIISPTTVDLVDLLDTNTEVFSRATTMRAVGVLVGSLFGPIVADKFRRLTDVYVCVACFVSAACSVVLPWCSNLVLMGLMWGLQGFVYGSCNVILSSVAFAIWGDRASAPVNAIHAAYSIGILVAPVLVTPFLAGTPTTETTHNKTTSEILINWSSPTENYSGISIHRYTFQENSTASTRDSPEPSITLLQNSSLTSNIADNQTLETQVYIPYAIAGILGAVVSLAYGVQFLLGHSYDTLEEELTTPSSTDKHSKVLVMDLGHRKFYVIILTVITLLLILNIGRDYTFTLYIFSIAVESQIQMTKQEAGILNTTYNAAMGIGRIVYSIILAFMPVQIILFSQCVMTVVIHTLLVLLGLHGVPQFWILTNLLGFFASPNNPTLIAWANRYIVCNGFAIAVFVVGVGGGGLIGTWVNGMVFESLGPWSLLAFSLGLTVTILAMLVPLQVYAHSHGDRHHPKQIPHGNAEPLGQDEHTPLLSSKEI